MKKINRRKLLKLMGVTAVTVSASSLICRDCLMANESSGNQKPTRCPHRFCKRYKPPEGGINEKGYSIYTAEEGFCTSDAFDGRPRI